MIKAILFLIIHPKMMWRVLKLSTLSEPLSESQLTFVRNEAYAKYKEGMTTKEMFLTCIETYEFFLKKLNSRTYVSKTRPI